MFGKGFRNGACQTFVFFGRGTPNFYHGQCAVFGVGLVLLVPKMIRRLIERKTRQTGSGGHGGHGGRRRRCGGRWIADVPRAGDVGRVELHGGKKCSKAPCFPFGFLGGWRG